MIGLDRYFASRCCGKEPESTRSFGYCLCRESTERPRHASSSARACASRGLKGSLHEQRKSRDQLLPASRRAKRRLSREVRETSSSSWLRSSASRLRRDRWKPFLHSPPQAPVFLFESQLGFSQAQGPLQSGFEVLGASCRNARCMSGKATKEPASGSLCEKAVLGLQSSHLHKMTKNIPSATLACPLRVASC